MRQAEAVSGGIGLNRSGKDLQPPYNVVITGGTKGVLPHELQLSYCLAFGCRNGWGQLHPALPHSMSSPHSCFRCWARPCQTVSESRRQRCHLLERQCVPTKLLLSHPAMKSTIGTHFSCRQFCWRSCQEPERPP